MKIHGYGIGYDLKDTEPVKYERTPFQICFYFLRDLIKWLTRTGIH